MAVLLVDILPQLIVTQHEALQLPRDTHHPIDTPQAVPEDSHHGILLAVQEGLGTHPVAVPADRGIHLAALEDLDIHLAVLDPNTLQAAQEAIVIPQR